jgi:uncharacterized protein involved in cysteine biosynthesis
VNILSAFSLAVKDALALEQRRSLLLSLGLTLLLLAALWVLSVVLLAGIHLSGIGWLDTAINILGGLATLVVAWVIFPGMTLLVLSFFLDHVAGVIERMHYPDLLPTRHSGIGEAVGSGLRLVALTLLLNLAMLPFYLFLPGFNLVLYYTLNGYLVGRAYFEPVALRRMEPRQVRAMWHSRKLMLTIAGAMIAFLLSVPFINLVAPLIGGAFMLHLFEALRRSPPARLTVRIL